MLIMTNTIKKGDFVKLNYTGATKDGTTFDTSIKKVAKDQKIYSEKQKYQPVKICVGEHQILEGIDQNLIGKQIGDQFTIDIPTELGFGKRDVKKVQLVPLSTFNEHKIKPFKGLQVDFDGQIGVVQRISGGRVMVNFNHALAGKDLVYEIELLNRITDPIEQATAYLSHIMPIKPEHIQIKFKDSTLSIILPFDIPESFSIAMTKKFQDLISNVKEVVFSKKTIDIPPNSTSKSSNKNSKDGLPLNPEPHLSTPHQHGPNCDH
jgi:FKBP-type peptidyl-prolyl cis-trans isomerase 2